jgi:hypothetical protein
MPRVTRAAGAGFGDVARARAPGHRVLADLQDPPERPQGRGPGRQRRFGVARSWPSRHNARMRRSKQPGRGGASSVSPRPILADREGVRVAARQGSRSARPPDPGERLENWHPEASTRGGLRPFTWRQPAIRAPSNHGGGRPPRAWLLLRERESSKFRSSKRVTGSDARPLGRRPATAGSRAEGATSPRTASSQSTGQSTKEAGNCHPDL